MDAPSVVIEIERSMAACVFGMCLCDHFSLGVAAVVDVPT